MGRALAVLLLLATARPDLDAARDRMVREQIAARGVRDKRVLAAMRHVPRHRFVPADLVASAYDDHPLAIGHDQTISQPYIVALMSELAALEPGAKVLEVGTGSGYQAAVLAELGAQVYTIEIVRPLCLDASARLQQLGYRQVQVRCGDGYRGWPDQAPFDAILVTAAPADIPQPLLDQLKDGGRLVLPVGVHDQQLLRVTRIGDGFVRERAIAVQFVPMTGEAQRPVPQATSRPALP